MKGLQEIVAFLEKKNIRFEKTEPIAKGAFNKVYAGFEIVPGIESEDRKVVIKIPRSRKYLQQLPSYESIQGKSSEVLNRSAMLLQKKLRHPSVPLSEVYHLTTENGDSIDLIVEDFAPGVTLEKLFTDLEFRRLNPEKKKDFLLEIFRQYAQIFSTFAKEKVFHNDIKPGNLKVDYGSSFSNPRVSVLDMNISKSFSSSEKYLGSEFFRSPEIFNGDSGSNLSQSDMFSLALTMYSVWTGGRTFVDLKSKKTPAMRHYATNTLTFWKSPREELDFTDMPKSVARVLDTCLSRHPHNRFESFDSLEQAILLEQQNIRSKTFKRRLKYGTLLGLSTAAALYLGFGFSLWRVHEYHVDKRSQEITSEFAPLFAHMVKPLRMNASMELPDQLAGSKIEFITRYDGLPAVTQAKELFSQNSVEKSQQDRHVFSYYSGPTILIKPNTNLMTFQITHNFYGQEQKQTNFIEFSKMFLSKVGRDYSYKKPNIHMNSPAGSVSFDLASFDMSFYIAYMQLYRPYDLSSLSSFSVKKEHFTRLEEFVHIELAKWSYSVKPNGFHKTPYSSVSNDFFSKTGSIDYFHQMSLEQRINHQRLLQKKAEMIPKTENQGFFEYLRSMVRGVPLERLMREGFYPKYLVTINHCNNLENYDIEWRAYLSSQKYVQLETSNPLFFKGEISSDVFLIEAKIRNIVTEQEEVLTFLPR
ncbi:MAG: protein kinase domain-containing protein [Candidatus Woesearchaeota archaeon]